MPYLLIKTTQSLSQEQTNSLMQQATKTVANLLNKSEQFVMIDIMTDCTMSFATSTEKLAFMTLKSINLADDSIPALSQGLCQLIQQSIQVEPDRIYIEFSNVERHKWGWNGKTF